MAEKKRKRLQKSQGNPVSVVDVARLAECSTATVSRVLNTPELVSTNTRNRVLAAINDLNYTPNNAARALRSNHSRMIGIVIPTLRHAIYANLVDAAQRRLSDAGHSLLVATFEYDLDREFEQTALLIERGADGLILVGETHRHGFFQMVKAAGIPYIGTYVFKPDTIHPCIGIDNFRASYSITEFLLGLGHRHFGVISAAIHANDRAATRVAGIRQALADHDLVLPDKALVQLPYSIDSGREGLRVLSGLTPRPTAVVCGNDILAFGALIASSELGLSVPGDLSIVGFDNLDFTAHLIPPMTTMEVPATEMGEGAAAFLLERLKGLPTAQKVMLETKLITRKTTGLAPRENRPDEANL